VPCASDRWSVRHKSCTSEEFTDLGMRELWRFGYLADWLLARRTNDSHCLSQLPILISHRGLRRCQAIGYRPSTSVMYTPPSPHTAGTRASSAPSPMLPATSAHNYCILLHSCLPSSAQTHVSPQFAASVTRTPPAHSSQPLATR
jgi:hypothetical protein